MPLILRWPCHAACEHIDVRASLRLHEKGSSFALENSLTDHAVMMGMGMDMVQALRIFPEVQHVT